MRKGIQACAALIAAAILLLAAASPAQAREARKEPLDSQGKRSWIVELEEPALVRHVGGASLQGLSKSAKGRKRIDIHSAESRSYRQHLDRRFDEFVAGAGRAIGGEPAVRARFNVLLNGGALRLTEEEAATIALLPGVKSVTADEIHYPETDSTPDLIGAARIWNGEGGLEEARGEGVVIGIIDTGINWDHPSFHDPSPDGYDHVNPKGTQLGLCNDGLVLCNDKLIGVYDFTDEGSLGRGTDFHGSHVASIAAGNPYNVALEGEPVIMSGMAPRANLISYKVCREDDPATEIEEGCSAVAIFEALEQTMVDGVDVVNLSIGGFPSSPWSGYARQFLDMREQGIFAATSAGNDGPLPDSVGYPAVAPWLLGVAATRNSRYRGAELHGLAGGDTPPPPDQAGLGRPPVNGSPLGIGDARIVWAGDYGHPLCGAGEPELLPNCDDHSGSSNPFPPGTFNGEIVVCERGTYGRVEKSYNVWQAGAGGYILVNPESWGEEMVPDNHCVPGIHIGAGNGAEFLDWLKSGDGHRGSIGPFGIDRSDSLADVVESFSPSGPTPIVPGTLTPNITAPGVEILGAMANDDNVGIWNGTSFSSPHVAGGGALLLSADPALTPSEIESILLTTAVPEVRNTFGGQATPFQMGTGRVQLDEAGRAGLYLAESTTDFRNANPAFGGDLKTLNLPALVDPSCRENCSFTRTVTDRAGGASWTASAENFPPGASVTVTPDFFSLSSGASRSLEIDIRLDTETVGDWVYGDIVLSSSGRPDQRLTVAVNSVGGSLPSRWTISSAANGGWERFSLSGLEPLANATFTAGDLVRPQTHTERLIEDPTPDEPFDNPDVAMVRIVTVPEGALWLHARTLSSTAQDLDLYVGRDANGQFPDKREALCGAYSSGDLETCDLFMPEPGDYWVLVHNFVASEAVGGDEVTLLTAVVAPTAESNFAVSGPGLVGENEPFDLRLSWDNINALPGEEWLGAVGVGSSPDRPGQFGVIPVHFYRSGVAPAETFPLMDGATHRLAIDASGSHNRLFIDVPSGAASLTVTASGADEDQSNGLLLDLIRLDFDEALSDPPFTTPANSISPVASARGANGVGPTVTVSGSTLQPGRWYPVLRNDNATPSAVEILATVEFDGPPLAIHPGLWEPISRPGLGQGYEFNWGGDSGALIWYTYDENGQPAWYIAGYVLAAGNIWTADLLRFTNDGNSQQSAPVGRVSITTLAENDQLFSYTLFGHSGTERMVPISALTCPHAGGSYTGIWYRGLDGVGGASVLVNSATQSQIHYLFDALGVPRWLYAQDLDNPEPTNAEIPMLQFHGYCAVCEPMPVGFDETPAGLLSRSFDSQSSGSWSLDYLFLPPLQGSAQRIDSIIKLTETLECQ